MKYENIENIWIESEENGPIIGGNTEINDNSDVIVTLKDKSQFIASFFTYQNISFLVKRYEKSGESLNGKYFFASDMILIKRLNRTEIENVIKDLLIDLSFESVFRKIDIRTK